MANDVCVFYQFTMMALIHAVHCVEAGNRVLGSPREGERITGLSRNSKRLSIS